VRVWLQPAELTLLPSLEEDGSKRKKNKKRKIWEQSNKPVLADLVSKSRVDMRDAINTIAIQMPGGDIDPKLALSDGSSNEFVEFARSLPKLGKIWCVSNTKASEACLT
jgi:hypothetical protein